MPAPGGQSTADGIRYEAWAVVYELTDVLTGTSDWVRPQAVSVGVVPGEPAISPVVDDYIVSRKGRRFYHSAKHCAPDWGRWTVCRLIKEGVLDQFAKQHREDQHARLVLTTQSASPFVGELCERARASESIQEFKDRRLTRALSQEWNRALKHLQCGEDELFALCRKVRLQRLTTDVARRDAERWLREFFSHGQALPSLLLELALTAATEGRKLDQRTVLDWLEQHGVYRMTPLSTVDLLGAVREAGASLREYPHDIASVHLHRAEVDDLVDWALAEDPDQKLAMLLDIFGGGKTVILRDVLLALEKAQIPTLAIKADLLSGLDRADDLKAALRLPADVEQVMAQLAAGGQAIAILDQLDALSLTLSRDQAALDLMLDTIARLRGIAGVRVIASCRTFDLNTDPKLSQIRIDRNVSPKPLTQEQVARVLEAAGIQAASLLPSLLELLCIPQNLKVFVEMIEARRANLNESNEQLVAAVGGFKSLQDLYGELWRQKVEFTPSGAPPAEERVAAIDLLVGYMHQHRRVSAPEPLLDSHIDAARYLEREDILRRDAGLWFFSHQTLYDYCYARRFIRQGSSLHDEILAGDQGLFVRSEMVQILTYLRGVDMAAYLEELERLLYAKPLRYHLRLLLLQWFGAIPDPTPDELVIAGRLLRDDHRRWGLMRGVMGNGAWFDLLDEELLDELLRHDDEQVTQQVVAYLESMVNVRTRRVLDRLQPRLGETESWDRHISRGLAQLENWSNRDAVDMLINLLTRGQMEKWLRLECMLKLAKSDPAAACHALRVYLDRRLCDWLAKVPGDTDVSTQNPNSILATRNEEYLLWDTVDHLSKACPTEFLSNILPWVRQVAERLARYSRAEVYYFDPLFSWAWHGQGLLPGSELVGACRTALRSVAVDEPELLRTIAVDLAQSQLYSMHRLLAQAFIAHPEAYGEDIFTYLSADTRRLHLGDMDAPYYDSHQLIGVAFPHLTREQCRTLESMILSYESRWERTTLGAWGYGQFQLLQAIPREQQSSKARLRLLELQRKFPDLGVQVPRGITGGFVGPPIDKTAQERMGDDAWLGAMGKYDDSTEWGAPREDFLTGGIIELSRALKEHAKAEPERFYDLALRFDESISSRYVAAVVGGIAESGAPAEYVFDLARRFATRTDSHLRMEICHAMSRRAQDGVPDDLLDTLSDYATGDRDPEQELWSQPSPNEEPWYLGDPHHHGINTVRGTAIGDLCRCALMRKPPKVRLAFRTLDQAVNDPSTAVRACAVDSLVYLLQHDEVRAVGLFERALDGHKALLRCQPTQLFLYYAHQSHFPRLRAFVEAMMTDDDEVTRQAGARLACLAAFSHPNAQDLADKAACGDAILRLGAAQVYAQNLTNPRLEDRCLARLTIMMRDTDGRVREEIGECFRSLRAEHLFRIRGFIRDFVSSPALAQGAFHLARYLRAYAAQDCALALEAVEAILNQLGDELMDMTRATAHVQRELVPMILAVYAHLREPEQRGRAMDLFEQLLARGSFAARTALQDYDRR